MNLTTVNWNRLVDGRHQRTIAASPDLADEIMNAVMGALAAHTVKSGQALE